MTHSFYPKILTETNLVLNYDLNSLEDLLSDFLGDAVAGGLVGGAGHPDAAEPDKRTKWLLSKILRKLVK